MPDSNHIYFNCNFGQVLYTDDGGSVWKVSTYDSTHLSHNDFYCKGISFDKASGKGVLYADSVKYTTMDGGLTFIKGSIAFPNLDAPGWSFPIVLSVDTIYCYSTGPLGKPPYFFNTSFDGGKNWQSYALQFNQVTAAYFLNESVGWIVSGYQDSSGAIHNKFFMTRNGGKEWKLLTDTIFIDSKLKTSSFGIHDLDFADSLHGLAIGLTSIIRTKDGGLSWQIDDRNMGSLNPGMSAVKYLSASSAVAASFGGTLLRWRSDSSTPVFEEATEESEVLIVCPNPASSYLTIRGGMELTAEIELINVVTGVAHLVRGMSNRMMPNSLHVQEFNTNDLPGGVYILRAFSSGNIAMAKVAIVH